MTETKKSDLKYVGKSYIREDAYDKARGKTQYTCDRQIAGMLYAKLVLSEKANAEISISTETWHWWLERRKPQWRRP